MNPAIEGVLDLSSEDRQLHIVTNLEEIQLYYGRSVLEHQDYLRLLGVVYDELKDGRYKMLAVLVENKLSWMRNRSDWTHRADKFQLLEGVEYSFDEKYKFLRYGFEKELWSRAEYVDQLRLLFRQIDNADPSLSKLRKKVLFQLLENLVSLYYLEPEQGRYSKLECATILAGLYRHVECNAVLFKTALDFNEPKAKIADAVIKDIRRRNPDITVPFPQPELAFATVAHAISRVTRAIFGGLFMLLGSVLDVVTIIPLLFKSGISVSNCLSQVAMKLFCCLCLPCICCCATRELGDEGCVGLLVGGAALAVLLGFDLGESRPRQTNIWGHEINNRWTDTGFAFIGKSIGNGIGRVIAFLLAGLVTLATYPFRWLFAKGEHLAEEQKQKERASERPIDTAMIQTALDSGEHGQLQIPARERVLPKTHSVLFQKLRALPPEPSAPEWSDLPEEDAQAFAGRVQCAAV